MSPLRPKPSSRIRFASGQVLCMEDLDRLLDVPVERFSARVDKLIRAMHSRGVRVEVDSHRERLRPSSGEAVRSAASSRFRSSRLYEADLELLPRMDRAEEYHMARRYELMRERARHAMQLAGLREPSSRQREEGQATLLEVLRGPRETLWSQLPRRVASRRKAHLVRCLEEFDAVRNLYVEAALHLVFRGVYRYTGLGVDTPDLVQEGNASLFQAIDGFDWRRDVRFKTYAQYWVHQAVLKSLYNASRTVRVPIWAQKLLKKIHRLQAVADSDGRVITTTEIGRELDIPATKVEELLAVRRYSRSLDVELQSGEGTTMAALLPDDAAEPIPEQIVEGDLEATLSDLLADLPEREQMILRRRFGLGGAEPETLGQIAGDLGVTPERVRQLQNAALGRLKRPGALKHLQPFT